jgi:geranylgeranyl pyrophosphate synthase
MLELLRNGSTQRNGEVAALLADSDSIDYARQTAYAHVRRSLDLLTELPPSDARASLTAMAEFILARRQ